MFNNYDNYLKELEIIRFLTRSLNIDSPEDRDNNLSNFVNILIVVENDLNHDHRHLINKITESIKKINSSITYKTMTYSDYKKTANKHDKILSFVQQELDCTEILFAPSIFELESKPELKRQLWQDMQDFCR